VLFEIMQAAFCIFASAIFLVGTGFVVAAGAAGIKVLWGNLTSKSKG
jgi:hypothetical protein